LAQDENVVLGQSEIASLANEQASKDPEQTEQKAESTIPEDLRGKSPEELAKIIQDQRSFTGRQGQELGDLRREVDNLKRDVSQQRVLGTPAYTAPLPPQEEPAKFDWDNPGQSVDERVNKKVGELYRIVQAENAMQTANYAEYMAKTQAPQLFEGQEADVRQVMINGVRTGLLHPTQVGNPEVWKMAAWQLRGNKSGYAGQQNVRPVNPSPTETPSGTRPPGYGTEEQISFTDQARQMAKGFGISEAKAAELLRARHKEGY
jgi:hypothetical protein